MSEKNIASVPSRKFTLQEARQLLVTVKEITAEAVQQAEGLEEENDTEGGGTTAETEKAMQGIIQSWAAKIAKLGCVPNGVWLVDFDNGAGYFCWQYGEEELGYFHTYEGGFAGRTAIN